MRDIRQQFIINHYAADVTYTVGSFLAKNNDTTPPDVQDLCASAKQCLVHEIFTTLQAAAFAAAAAAEAGAGAGDGRKRSVSANRKNKFTSVSGVFTKQIETLIANLQSTRCSFILCIKPNYQMQVGVFDRPYVMEQLQCTGTVQTCEVLRVGLPTRVFYSEIAENFKKHLPADTLALFGGAGSAQLDRRLCEGILFCFEVDPYSYALGLTRLFFRTGKIAELDALLKKSEVGGWVGG
jgi:myosin heavy subunit